MTQSYLIGNWKLFKIKTDIDTFFRGVSDAGLMAKTKTGVGFAIAVSPTHLDYAQAHAPKGLEIFSQNCAYASEGAWTGEISPLQLKDLGVTGTLVGHSERRQHFGDTNQSVAKRAVVALEHGLKVVFCVGETLEERDAGRTEALLGEQITALLESVDVDQLKAAIAEGQFWVAYEPVWAIGTGRTASPEMAESAHMAIAAIFDRAGAGVPKILYGGSVKPSNFRELLAKPSIAGGLVGGASLEASSYLTLAASFE